MLQQQYYNKISEQKRIAFIDNLTDQKAKELSNAYPFPICFASEEDYPVILYNKKRYGFTSINTDVVQINDVLLQLQIDENGQIKLCCNPSVNDYSLNFIKYLYNNGDYSESISPTTQTNSYVVRTISNKAVLYFKFYKVDGENITEITDKNYNIDFSRNDEYYSIVSNPDVINSYILTVKKSNSNISITTNFAINGNVNTKNFNFNLIKTPEENYWITSSNGATNESRQLSLYQSQKENTPIKFGFNDGNLDGTFKISLLKSDNTIINENVTSGIDYSTDIFNAIGNVSHDQVYLQISEVGENAHSIKLNRTQLTINFVTDSNSIFYIGPVSESPLTTATVVNTNEYIINNITQIPILGTVYDSSIYILPDYGYDFNRDETHRINVNTSDIIILPEGYKLALPFYNDYNSGNLTNPINDPMWILDTDKGNNGIIKINDKNYKVYKYDTSYELDNPQLLSIIVSE